MPSRKSSFGNVRAFTLIEVVVALVIFALMAVVLGSAYVNVLNSYEIARKLNQRDQDLDFARSQLLAISDLQKAEAGDEFDDGDRHVKWTADIEPAGATDLFTVTFTYEVTDPAQPASQKTVETFMLLRPTWSDPVAQTKLRQAAADRIALAQGRQAP